MQDIVTPRVESDRSGSSFQVDQIQDRRVYRLPRRNLDISGARMAGWAALAGGLFVVVFVLCWMAFSIIPGILEIRKNNDEGWMMVGYGCLGFLGLLPAIGIVLGGLAILGNKTHCTIELDQTRIRSQERFWFLRWKRQQHLDSPFDSIVRLRVTNQHAPQDQQEPEETHQFLKLIDWLRKWNSMLVAETENNDEYLVAVAYPRELLLELAHDLAPRLNSQATVIAPKISRDRTPLTGRETIGAIEIIDDELLADHQPDDVADIVARPTDSTLTIEHHDNGITLDVPPVGFKANLSLVIFTIVWMGFIGFAFISLLIGNQPDRLQMMLFLVPFFAVGVLLSLVTIHMSRTKTTFATADDLLFVKSQSPIRTRQKEWSRDRIHSINLNKSNMQSSDQPIMELQIHAVGEQQFACLSQLDNSELQWIASELRQSLNIVPGSTASFSNVDSEGRKLPLPESKLSAQYSLDAAGAQSITIDVPPRGILHSLLGILGGSLFVTIAVAAFFIFMIANAQNNLFITIFVSIWAIGFGGVGIATILFYVSAAKIKFWIHVERDQLQVRHSGLLGTKTFSYPRDELRPLKISQSVLRNSNVPRSEIIVRPRDPSSAKLLRGFDHDDLAFVVEAINETMQLTTG